jgi:hypothetical protein
MIFIHNSANTATGLWWATWVRCQWKGSLTSDRVTGVSTLAYGGTLTVSNLAGTLTNGQAFQRFSATSYSGNFAATNLPALDPSLAWVWSPASGTLAVTSAASPPTITLTSPTNDATYAGYATIPISASVVSNGTAITSVDFLTNGTVLATVSVLPYNATWTLALPGAYSVVARANYGSGSVSATNTGITVNAPQQAALSAVKKDANGYSFSFSGPTGQPYSLLSAINVALPLSQWSTNQVGFLAGPGNPVGYTNATPTEAQRFYDVRTP